MPSPFQQLGPEELERLRLRSIDKITVCDRCLRACCWLRLFVCDEAVVGEASTTEITVAEARRLDREDESYWQELRRAEGVTGV